MFNSKKTKIITISIFTILIIASILIIINLNRLRIYPVEPAITTEVQNKYNACLVDVASRYGEQKQIIQKQTKDTEELKALLSSLNQQEEEAENNCLRILSPSL